MAFFPQLRAVLFDRDGTLVVDVPYNGDPERVVPLPGAAAAVERARRAGCAVGVVSNQSGIGRGIVSAAQVERVNARVDTLVGPFDTWHYCPHAPEDGCACRKPRPALVLRACAALGVRPEQTVVIGDIAADLGAAASAGALGVLVPTVHTRRDEVARAPHVAPDLLAAVELALTLGPATPAARGAAG